MDFDDIATKIDNEFKERESFYFDFDDCFLRISLEVKEDAKEKIEGLLDGFGYQFIARKMPNDNVRYAIVVWER